MTDERFAELTKRRKFADADEAWRFWEAFYTQCLRTAGVASLFNDPACTEIAYRDGCLHYPQGLHAALTAARFAAAP